MIFYPHYCYDCHCTYISDKRLDWCWACHSWNVINCCKETGKQTVPRETLKPKHRNTKEINMDDNATVTYECTKCQTKEEISIHYFEARVTGDKRIGTTAVSGLYNIPDLICGTCYGNVCPYIKDWG